MLYQFNVFNFKKYFKLYHYWWFYHLGYLIIYSSFNYGDLIM